MLDICGVCDCDWKVIEDVGVNHVPSLDCPFLKYVYRLGRDISTTLAQGKRPKEIMLADANELQRIDSCTIRIPHVTLTLKASSSTTTVAYSKTPNSGFLCYYLNYLGTYLAATKSPRFSPPSPAVG